MVRFFLWVIIWQLLKLYSVCTNFNQCLHCLKVRGASEIFK